MSGETDHADVLQSFLDYKVFYKEPIFEAWHSQLGNLTLALFRTFREWNVGLENISANQNPTDASELRINVDLLNKKAIFSVGLGAASLSVIDPNWSEAAVIIRIAEAGLSAVKTTAAPEFEKQQLTLVMHLRPSRLTLRDIGSGFLNLQEEALVGDDIRAYGVAAYREDGHWVIDPSTVYPDALFVRLQRSYDVDVSLASAAEMLRDEEGRLLAAVRLRID